MISKDVMPDIIERSIEMGKTQLKKLREVLFSYAKRKEIETAGRKYFYIGIEEVDVRYSEVFGDDNADEDVRALVGHNRETSDEVLNHLLAVEGIHTHSHLDDHIKNNDPHHLFMADDDSDDDYVDPYENLTPEEMAEKLPPYFNKSFNQKKKFFKKLNQKYNSSLKMPAKGQNTDIKTKLQFDLKKNSIRKFKRLQKVVDKSKKKS